jgi:CRP-like cAMP-binding protein
MTAALSREGTMQSGRPLSRLLQRLEGVMEFRPADIAALETLPINIRNLAAGEWLAREGDVPSRCHLLLAGYLCRMRIIEGGQRQILAFLVPGDFADLQTLHLERLDHGLAALGPVTVGAIDHGALRQLMAQGPHWTHVLWRENLLEAARMREAIVNIGQRHALARVAHLICGLTMRLRAVGLARDFSFPAPWTQSDLADAAGISTVHANRVLQDLRRWGMVDHHNRTVRIHDWPALCKAADFTPDHLHLTRDPIDVDGPTDLSRSFTPPREERRAARD